MTVRGGRGEEYSVSLTIPSKKKQDEHKGFAKAIEYFEANPAPKYPIILIQKKGEGGINHWVNAIGLRSGGIVVYDSQIVDEDRGRTLLNVIFETEYMNHLILEVKIADQFGKCMGHQGDFYYDISFEEGSLLQDDSTTSDWDEWESCW